MPRKPVAVKVASKGAVRAKAAPVKAVKAAARAAAKAPAKAVKPAAPARAGAPKSARPNVKAAVKAAAKTLAAPAPARAVRKKVDAPATAARPALVRDSFTMPEGEYAVLADVKGACLRAGIEVKKSELLRVGVALLGQVDIATLKAVLAALPQLKTGRPPAGS